MISTAPSLEEVKPVFYSNISEKPLHGSAVREQLIDDKNIANNN